MPAHVVTTYDRTVIRSNEGGDVQNGELKGSWGMTHAAKSRVLRLLWGPVITSEAGLVGKMSLVDRSPQFQR